MANFASRTYQIITSPQPGDDTFLQELIVGGGGTSVEEDPVFDRTSQNQFSTSLDTVNSAAQFMAFAINDDYGAGGRAEEIPLVATSLNDTFTITATDYGFSFDGVPETDWLVVTETIPEVPPIPDFEITDITAQAADNVGNRNTHARFNLSVANGVAPYNITSPVSKAATLEADLFYDWLRNPPPPLSVVSVVDDNLDEAIFPLGQPSADLITLDSVNILEGVGTSTVTINISIAESTNFDLHFTTFKEYSINNLDWFVSPNFENVVPDNYTAYVRDDFGALLSLAFEVVGLDEEKLPFYFDIPAANPLRHIKDIDFTCGLIPNWQNALFAKLLETQFPNVENRPYNQLITDCDTIITQVHSNYETVEAKIIDCAGDEIILPLVLKQEYIDKEDLRDCSFKQITSNDPIFSGKTLVYFTGGKIYDPSTELEISTYSNPRKSIFPFAKYGTLFTISGTTLLNGDYIPIGEYYDTETGYWGISATIFRRECNNRTC